MTFSFNILFEVDVRKNPRNDVRIILKGGDFFQANTDLGGEIDTKLTSLKGVFLSGVTSGDGENHRYSISSSMVTITTDVGAISGSWMVFGKPSR